MFWRPIFEGKQAGQGMIIRKKKLGEGGEKRLGKRLSNQIYTSTAERGS